MALLVLLIGQTDKTQPQARKQKSLLIG